MRQASRLDVDLRVMTLPDGQDPDDVIRQTPDLWRELAEHARPVADYVISVGTAGVTPESALADREKVARDLLPILVATENNLQEQTNIQQLAFKLRLDNKVLMQWALEHRLKLTPRQSFVKSPTAKLSPPPTASGSHEAPAAMGGVPAPIAPGADTASPPPDPKPETKLLSPAGAAVERYCLAVLLRNPSWLPGINRKFREVANTAHVGDDVLGGLMPQDFSNSDYRAIFSTMLDAMAQFEIEPEAYLTQNLPYELQQHVNDLLLYPLERFEQTLSPLHTVEMQQVKRDQQRMSLTGGVEQELRVLQRHALDLRKARLKRENVEIQFLQHEEPAEEAAGLRLMHRQSLNTVAIGQIELAVKALSRSMR
jgi:DNA primase